MPTTNSGPSAKQRATANVLFLCTGNYYRSRYAEVLFHSTATKMGLAWTATSRALALERGAGNVGPMARSAIEALEKAGIRAADMTGRAPCAVVEADFTEAKWVVALLEAEHRPLMEERFPNWGDQVEYWHVQDRAGVLPEIEREVMDLISRLMRGGIARPSGPITQVAPVPPREAPPKPKKLGLARVGRETAGRRGKGVTTVFDMTIDEAGLKELATKLKNLCGTGGTAKDGRIEIQGDHRDKIMAELEKMGYQVKRSGG